MFQILAHNSNSHPIFPTQRETLRINGDTDTKHLLPSILHINKFVFRRSWHKVTWLTPIMPFIYIYLHVPILLRTYMVYRYSHSTHNTIPKRTWIYFCLIFLLKMFFSVGKINRCFCLLLHEVRRACFIIFCIHHFFFLFFFFFETSHSLEGISPEWVYT